MSQIYMKNRMRPKDGPGPRQVGTGPSMAELAAGAAPTAEQIGSRVDLPGEIREKMESSFGADFSNVKLYESETVAEAGAEAVTQGNSIAFAPGKLDLTSTAGQALLGHELSHVVSQARGESAGRGFLNDPHLEAQADRQGMMAAQGESVYSGPVSAIGASTTASAAGPIQAKKHEEKADIQMERQGMQGNARDLGYFARKRLAKAYDAEEERRRKNNLLSSGRIDEFDASPETADAEGSRMVMVKKAFNSGNQIVDMADDDASRFSAWVTSEFGDSRGNDRYQDNDYIHTGDGRTIRGLGARRSSADIRRLGVAQGMSEEEIKKLMVDLMLKNRIKTRELTPEETEDENRRTDEALKKLKGIYAGGFKAVRDKYGVTMSQLHPEDAFNQAVNSDYVKDTHIAQDVLQLRQYAPELFDENNEEDQELIAQSDYYTGLQKSILAYGGFSDAERESRTTGGKNALGPMLQQTLDKNKENEARVLAFDRGNMPKMGQKERKAYQKKALAKYGDMGLKLF